VYVHFTVREDKGRSNSVHAATVSSVEVYKTSAGILPGKDLATSSAPFVDDKVSYFLGGVNSDAASKVVDANGEPMVVHHATDGEFFAFDRGHLGKNTDANATDEAPRQMARLGFWFNTQDLRVRTAASRDVAAFLDVKRPFETTFEDLWDALADRNAATFIRELEEQGFDGIALEDSEFGGTSFVAFKPEQIKSADPATYDDAGNLIPLSRRFDAANADIRFSVNTNLRADIAEALNTDLAKGTVVKGGKRVVFGRSLRLFPALGLPDGIIYSKAYALRKIAAGHNLTAEQIASAPDLMEEPAAVFDDDGKGYVFLTDAIAPDRNAVDAPVMFYVRPDGEGNYIASAYSRTEDAEAKYVNLVNAGKVLYLDKSKIARLPLRGEALSSLITFSAGDSVVTPEGLTARSIAKTAAQAQGGGRRFSIVGRSGAKELGIGGLAEAEAMEKSGAGREEIWRKTGWWRGKDGQWRIELPDVKMKNERKLFAAFVENGNDTTLGKIPAAMSLRRAVSAYIAERESSSGGTPRIMSNLGAGSQGGPRFSVGGEPVRQVAFGEKYPALARAVDGRFASRADAEAS